MKLSDGVEWGVHVCTLLAAVPPDNALPAAKLAEYHGVPSAYLAKHLQALASAGVFETVKGPRGGYRLARPAAKVTMLDIVEAIDGEEPAFRCTEIRRRGPTAVAGAGVRRVVRHQPRVPAGRRRVACRTARDDGCGTRRRGREGRATRRPRRRRCAGSARVQSRAT